MEGGVEGMVAVIRGLQDTGLAVTLINGELNTRASVYAPRAVSPLPSQPTRNTDGTNTNVLRTNIGAQACDGRYTSSYQLAHCNQRPSSPPVLPPEFPLRKDVPKSKHIIFKPRDSSNFEVGWKPYGMNELPSSSLRAAGSTTPYRSTFHYPDRGPPSFENKASDTFAASLRRYSMSPDRTLSAELVQKLISFTVNKNNANSKASTTLKEKIEVVKKRFKDKDVQTYTRSRPKKEGVIDVAKGKSVKRMRTRSPVKDSRYKRHNDGQLNETYDYLKSNTPRVRCLSPEVRYLSDVSRCIKETIRQIVDGQPEVCAEMHNRYLAHRKKCPPKGSKQVGESSQSRDFEGKSGENLEDSAVDTCLPTCPLMTAPCCYCSKESSLTKRDSKEEFGQKVSEKIGTWLLNIPAHANISLSDKQKRIDMIENLANVIASLKDDDDIEEKARKEIDKCLDRLPMWLPSAKSERDGFKNLIANNLMNKLKQVFKGSDKFDDEISNWVDKIRFKSRDSLGEVVDKDNIANNISDRIKSSVLEKHDQDDFQEVLKKEIVQLLEELPIVAVGDKEQFIDQLADKLTNTISKIPVSEMKYKGDEFDNKISKWMSDIKFKKRDSEGNLVDKRNIIDKFSERLKSLALERPSNNEEYHECLKNEIIDILGELPLETSENKEQYIDKLASILTDEIKKIPASKIKPKRDKFDEIILQWIGDVKFKKKDSQGIVVDKNKIAEEFSERLKSLATERPEDDKEYHEALKNEIVDILEKLPVETFGNKEQFIDKLATNLTNVVKKIPVSEIKPKGDKFDDKISQFLKGVKFKKKDSSGNVIEKVDKRQIADQFAERLKSIAIERPEDDKEYHEVLKNEIVDILNDLPIETFGDKDNFIDKLATKLTNVVKKIPVNEIKTKDDKFDDTISQWIKDIKFKKQDSQGNIIDKQKIAEEFSDRLKSLAADRPEDDKDYHEALKNEIVDILETLPVETFGNRDKFIDKLATKLTNVVKKMPVSEIKPKGDKFDEKISQWMEDIKFKKKDSLGNVVEKVDKGQLTAQVAERLKSIAIERPEDDKEYHEALKNEIVDILNDLPIETYGDKEKFVDKLASKLTNFVKKIPVSDIKTKGDKFDDKISQWLGDIKFKKKDSLGNIVDKGKIADTFSERLKSIAIERPEDDKEYHEILKREIVDILEDLPIETFGDKEQYIDKLATKLTNVVKKIPTSVIKPKGDKFDDKISQWLGDIKFKKKDSLGNIVDKGKIADTFSERLKSIAIERPEDDKEYHEILKREIVDILEDLPIETFGDKEQYIDKLATKLTNVVKKIPTSVIKPKGDKFDDKISQWLGDIKFKKKDSLGNIVDKGKIADTFSERLKSIAIERPEDDKEYHEILKREIVDILEDLPIETFGDKEQYIDKLATKLTNVVKKIPTSVIKPKGDKFDDKISQWVADIKFKKKDSQGNLVDKRKIADTFTEKLKSIAIERPDDEKELKPIAIERPIDDDEYHDYLKNEIVNILNELPIETFGDKGNFLEKLANKLTNLILKIPASEIMPKPTGIDIKSSFQDNIVNWLKGIPELSIIGNINDKGNKLLVENLTKKLQTIQSKGKDNESVKKEMDREIQDWMQAALTKQGEHINYKTKSMLSDKLIRQLMNTVNGAKKVKIQTDKQPFTEDISEWLKYIPQLSGDQSEQTKMISDLATRIQSFTSGNKDDKKGLQNEIMSWLSSETEKKGMRIDYRTKEELANKLAEQLFHSMAKDRFSVGVQGEEETSRSGADYKNECMTEIQSWLENIPELSGTKQQNDKMVQNLTKKMEELQSNGLKDKDEIQDEITDWLNTELEKKGTKLDLKTRNNLISQLADNIAHINPPQLSDDEFKHKIYTGIWNELKKIHDIEKSEINEELIRQLSEKMKSILKQHDDQISDENIRKEITDWLDDFIYTTGIKLESKIKNKLTNDLISYMKNVLNPRAKHDKMKQTISSEVSDIINSETLKLSPKEKKNVERRVSKFFAENIDSLMSPDNENIKSNILKILGQETNISEEEANRLTEKIISNVKRIPLSRKISLKAEYPDGIKEVIRGNVKNALRDYNISNVNEIQKNITDLLEDLVLHGVDTKTTKERIFELLNSTNLPENDAKDLSSKLTLLGLDLSSIRDETATLPSELTLLEKDMFQTSAFKEITDFMEEVFGEMDPKYKRKIQIAAQKLVERLSDIMSDRNKSKQDKDNVLKSEVSNFLKSFSIPVEEYGPILENQLQNKAVTSTPRGSMQDLPIYSRKTGLSFEYDYVSDLDNIIKNWIRNLSIEIGDASLVDDIARGLATDIADRTKYLKSHAIKQSEDDKLEFLKYQIFRALGKVVDENKLASIMKQIVPLYRKMNDIASAMNILPQTPIDDERLQQDTTQFLEENLYSGITDWLKSLPLYQRRNSNEKRIQENVVKDLIKDLKNIILTAKDDANIDIEMLQAAKNHIQKFPMDQNSNSDNAYIEKVAAQLVDYLNNMQLYQNVSSRQSTRPLEYLISTVNDWLDSIPLDTSHISPNQLETLKMNILKRLNQLKDNIQENEQIIKDEILLFLQSLPLNLIKIKNKNFVQKKADELFKNILGTPFLTRSARPTIGRDLVESAVQNWSKKLPYKPGSTPESVLDQINKFTSDISDMLKETKVTAIDNDENNLLEKTIDFLKQMPIQLEKMTHEGLKNLADDLLTTIKNKAADLSPKSMSRNTKDTLYENISTWCDDLPIFEGNTPEEKERANNLKQSLVSRLVNKIGELNMNPEILNDDFLYEHLLEEEIEDLLSDLPPSPEIQNNFESIKKNLMTKIIEGKKKTQDELAGQTYKQQLRDTISKSLPFDVSLDSDGPEAFQVLVDNLADAFVDLHFVTDDEEQQAKYKNKIADEITKYCNNFLKHHPEAPIDAVKINQDLYSALKNIPTPKDDIMRSEAEHVRIKDEISNWIKDLPLIEGSGPQQVQKNKMASVLAKKLLEIETNPEIDYEEKAEKGILKFLKKLPIKPGREADTDKMVKQLIDKLKSSEKSRKISASITRHPIDLSPDSDVIDSSARGSAESSDEHHPSHQQQKTRPCKNLLCLNRFPKSTLSTDDRAHLERIRIRSRPSPCRLHRERSCKDASVNPVPVDVASQTDVCPNISSICPSVSCRPSPCSQQDEVCPQVIIKEYLWDSCTSKLIGPVYRLPCVEVDTSSSSMPTAQRPLQKSVSIQPSPSVIPERPCAPPNVVSTPRPCIRSPCPSPHQLTPKPCVNLPKSVISSLPSNICTNRSVNTTPCEPVSPCRPQEMPYCTTPRRPVRPRDFNMPFRQPCFQPSFSKPCSPVETESDAEPSRCFPRVINLGSFDIPKSPCQNTCRRRRIIQEEEHLSDYNNCQDYRRKIHRMQSKPCQCDNRRPRNVCRHRSIHTPCRFNENVRKCSKCCGLPCPHPMGIFFR
ncbi:uncharacterized protein LOC106131747 [Amyelois transitella]|uniref:uncharacterized protein LOC106131747 n=1 Tax=Amyelois transitella TaxID=680683 RepID=UPI00298F5890|nr:uncharacterized protein LOC106131747 [Amyelois transitella]